MHSNGAVEGLALISAGLGLLAEVDWAVVALRDRLEVLETVETDRRWALAVSNAIAATVADEDFTVLGDTPKKLIADCLRIKPAQAAVRLKQAELLRARTTLTGQALAAHLPTTAQLWHQGVLDADHVAEIVRFFAEIPCDTPVDIKESSEKFLAEKAVGVRPDQLKVLAAKMAATINPDGTFSDKDRRQKSDFRWTSQRRDGMSRAVLWATPQLRAELEAFFAKYAEPGRCLPDEDEDQFDEEQCETPQADKPQAEEPRHPTDEPADPDADTAAESPTSPAADSDTSDDATDPDTPDVAADRAAESATTAPAPAAESAPQAPQAQVARRDFRTPGQRRHDALSFWMRSVLGNPALGTHHGLPLTLVVTVDLKQLCRGAGIAITTSGTVIPIPDLIRMASKSYRYLEIFDGADRRVLDLYRARRCATGDQWLALFGRDRGCTKPTCDKPADDCQAHHTPDYAANGQTNINMMGLACFIDHPHVKPGGWSTHMRGGTTEWEPPPQYPRKAPTTNTFHHPERYLHELNSDDDDYTDTS